MKAATTFRGLRDGRHRSARHRPDHQRPEQRALGGKVYAIGSAELTIPTFLPEQYGIKAALFSDFGTSGLLDSFDKKAIDPATGLTIQNPLIKDDLGLRASAGLSIFWKSPMGPIRFDFSQILKKDDYDRTETFRFSTNTRF